jgi:aspartyl aminopeptidase
VYTRFDNAVISNTKQQLAMLSKIGVRTVDIGGAMLSMHSIRETAGSHDVQHITDLFDSFFEGFPSLDSKLSLM